MSNAGEILFKIKGCGHYYMLHELEEDFNKVGLTIQTTLRDNKILCRIVDGKPYSEKLFSDYVFMGMAGSQMESVPKDIIETICEFVINNATGPSKVVDTPRVWRHGSYVYGHIVVVNEGLDALCGHAIDPLAQKNRRPIKSVIRDVASDLPEDIDHLDTLRRAKLNLGSISEFL